MYNSALKRVISVIVLIVFLMAQITVANGTSSNVQYNNAAQYASSGKTNCFPDKGEWGLNDDKFYIQYNSESGDEMKPVNGDSDFTYNWYMPLEGVKAQIDNGLKYSISLDVFGHLIDGDTANIYIDFWVPYGGGITGFVTDQYLQENVDLWKHRSFSGYIPENATYMRLRLTGTKAKDFFADDDCAIFFRNIEVYIIDDILPQPTGIEYGASYELGTAEARRAKDYYGVDSDVYWDLEFNEPVFVNDPGYLAYARSLSGTERSSFASGQLAVKYPNDQTVITHVLQNSGRTTAEQFGELKLKFKYKNSDGTDKTGYAAVVDRSQYNKETYGNDYSKQIKFKYTVQPGDDFQADDIYEMELQGGIITDNSFNMMPDERRKISFDTNSESSLNKLYRSYFRNFRVETTAPVLLEINGRNPEGQISENTDLALYFKFSEPVYITMSDEEFIKNSINKFEYNSYSYNGLLNSPDITLKMNSQYVDQEGKAKNTYGTPTAYYWSGNGTTMLKFGYYVHENKFDPLEIISSEIKKSGISCGEIYVMDAAGNTAPLLQDNSIKLSDNKFYIADKNPPEISVQSMKAEDGKGGFYVKLDVTDKGSGVDYDNQKFGFGYASSLNSSISGNMKPFIPGRKYHSKELSEMFGVDISKSDTFKVVINSKDKNGNDSYDIKYGGYWNTVISIDTAAPVLDSCNVLKGIAYGCSIGRFYARINDGDGKSAASGMGNSPDIKYKWVDSGFNPDMEEWLPVTRAYHGGMGIYHAEGPAPSNYIYKDADLYLKAVDLAGNESVFHIPKALAYGERLFEVGELQVSPYIYEYGRVYEYKAEKKNRTGVLKPIKGLWYCMTREAKMPEFSEGTGIWKYKDGNGVNTADDFEGNPRDRNGYYYLHIRAVDSSNNLMGAATVQEALPFDFKKPEISVDTERQADGSWVVRADITDDSTARKDIKAKYSINTTYSAESDAWKDLPSNGEIKVDAGIQNTHAYVAISASDVYNNGITTVVNLNNLTRKLSDPYVDICLPKYNGKAYTNEDFVQLLLYTEADEFSYSQDGVSWSSWIPLVQENDGWSGNVARPYVPLPDKEGEITFYTSCRRSDGEQTGATASTVVRDITPPTGEVSYSSYNNSTYWFNAKLTDLSDNLCPKDAIESVGGDSMIIEPNTKHYFVIKDAAGNKAEVMAYNKVEVPVVVEDNDDDDDDDDDDDGPPPDTTAPVISVSPNGETNQYTSISPQISAEDEHSISEILYAFSIESDIDEVTNWEETSNGSYVSLSGVTGTYYLHVKATDASGNTSAFTSESYNMVQEYTEPTVVYSGEADGTGMRAFLVSPNDITVTEAVYDLHPWDEGPHTFEYIYGNGSAGEIDASWPFDDYEEWEMEYKGSVSMEPYDRVTSGPVVVTIEAPDNDPGSDWYMGYDNSLEIDPGDNVRILAGTIREEIYIDSEIIGEITEESPVTYNEDYLSQLAEEENYVAIYKAEITLEENGIIEYGSGDGNFAIQVNHIVDTNLEDNVTVTYLNNGWRAYGTETLLVSANKYAGMLISGGSLSGADLTPPVGQITYTADDWKKGPVTANIKLTDNSGGSVTITNNGGSSSHVFNNSGQFVFEFVDKAGNKGRALAEASTIVAAAPKVDVSYSTKLPTKDAVKVTLKPDAGVTLKSGGIPTVLENGSYSFNALNNGQWKFTFANEAGIETEVTAAVENVDKTPPKLWADYIGDPYNNSVAAIVRSDEVILPGEGSELRHVFQSNGQYVMKAQDACGNEAGITATVDNGIKVNYSTKAVTNKPVKITLTSDKAFTVLNNSGKTEKTVEKNGKYQFLVKDSMGIIQVMEAEVNNIDTEAPVITLGYPDEMSILVGESVNLMNFTAVDNFDGNVAAKVRAEGNINTRQPGTYQTAYSVTDSCGNTAVKVLEVTVLGTDDQIVLINGIKHESEPLVLSASQLKVSTKGFAGQVKVKWTKGFESVAFFKDGGTETAADTVPVSSTGWLTLYIYDNERNSRLVHIFINNAGGEQQ